MNNMKLPSINQKPDKPTSAQSSRSQNISQKGASASSNLERNLFSKLQQYDDLHNIKTVKPAVIATTSKEHDENNTIMKFLSGSNLEAAKHNDIIEDDHPIILHKARHSENNTRVRILEEDPHKVVSNTPKTVSNISKTMDKPRSIMKQKSQNVEDYNNQPFMTMVQGQQNMEQDKEGSEDEQVASISKRQKDRQQTRRMLNYVEDEDLGQVNNLIFQTNNDMSDFYSSITTVKNTINEMTFNVKSLGIAVRPELMDLLDSQYQELLEMQRQDDALEEFDLEQMRQYKPKAPQAVKTSTRASSQIPQKKVNKKKNKANDSFTRK